MYEEFAGWFHLLTAPEDYEEEAAVYLGLLKEARRGPIATMLELGAGGGNNASWYKREVPEVVLSDLSPAMVEQSERLNPECEHFVGDMRTLRLERTFDAVFIHDAIDYMTSEADLAACLETAAAHLAPGGAALFVPDAIRETWTPSTHQGGHDAEDGQRALRYLEWTSDRDPDDGVYETDYAYLIRDGDVVKAAYDHHTCGLFPRATWVRLIEAAGFEVLTTPQMEWQDDIDSQVAFVARRRG